MKILKFKLLFTLLAMLFCAISSAAHDFEVNGIYYTVTSFETSEVSVDGLNNSLEGIVTIPSSIVVSGRTFTVTSIKSAKGAVIETVVIPSTVSQIGNSAFASTTIEEIYLPDNVTSLGEAAFYNCTRLKKIRISPQISTLPKSVFERCSSLVSIDWSPDPTSSGRISERAFYYCTALKSIKIPASVTELGKYGGTISNLTAFYNCTALDSLIIEDGSTILRINEASAGTVSSSAIGEFEGSCINYVYMGRSYKLIHPYWEYPVLTYVEHLEIGDQLTEPIWLGTYSDTPNMKPLKTLIIGKSVREVGNYTNNTDLEYIKIKQPTPPRANGFSNYIYINTILYVPKGSENSYKAADYWKYFFNVVGFSIIDDFEIDGIYYHALSENTAIVIKHPEIGNFYCDDVVIPDSVTYQDMQFAVVGIDDRAFEDCSEVTSVVIGNSVESIGEEAFHCCSSLTSLTIGSGVTTIGANAFNYCNSLQTVSCLGAVPPVMENSNCFSTAAYRNAILYVPEGLIETYSAADYWYKFEKIMDHEPTITGDVNGDGEVNIADINAVIDMILSGTFNANGDVNGDGEVNIADINAVINVILN